MKKVLFIPLMVAAAFLTLQTAPVYVAAADNDKTAGEKIDDSTITGKVKMELVTNKATSAMDTRVTTSNGVVTLTGKAINAAEKELAEKVAREVNGVKKVVNKIVVE